MSFFLHSASQEILLRQQRINQKMTQEYIALELSISRPTYMQIERGKREITISEAKKFAALFGMSLENFLAMKEPRQALKIKKESIKTPETLQVRITEKNLDKFKQVLLYILNKVGGKPNVGETVLHKLLYFIDFDYYEEFEENLIGATYIKNYHGPTPVEFSKVIEEMQKAGEIKKIIILKE